MNGVVAYLGHPIGEANGFDSVQRADNLANAVEWVRFFNDVTRWSIVCPWYVNAVAIGGDSYGPRRLMSQLDALERCDIYIAAGGHLSPHMHVEMRRAKQHGLPILDVSNLGVIPPAMDDGHAQHLKDLASRAIASRPRRVWMPLLTPTDIATLQAARHELYIDTVRDQAKAVEILDRIIKAAAVAP